MDTLCVLEIKDGLLEILVYLRLLQHGAHVRTLRRHCELGLDALCLFLCRSQKSFNEFFIFMLMIVDFILL